MERGALHFKGKKEKTESQLPGISRGGVEGMVRPKGAGTVRAKSMAIRIR